MPPGTAPKRPRFFLDSSAFLHGASYPPGECATTASILAEFRPGGRSYDRTQQYVAAGLLVVDPLEGDLQRVREAARASGAAARLSGPDQDLLAAALGHPDPTVVTDDYTLQDVARRLGVPTRPIQTAGIDSTRDWAARCSGCGRAYAAGQTGTPCRICGAEVKLKIRRGRQSL